MTSHALAICATLFTGCIVHVATSSPKDMSSVRIDVDGLSLMQNAFATQRTQFGSDPRALDLISAFASLAVTSANSSKKQPKKTGSPTRVAVCTSGHVRSFVFPGVHTSWIPYLFQGQDSATEVKLFFIGHLHEYGGNWNSVKFVNVQSQYLQQKRLSEQEAVDRALSMFDHPIVSLDNGGCEDLKNFWKSKGIERNCTGRDGNFMQIMWVDACIQKVKEHGDFDYIVRIRPDVALFRHVNFNALPRDKVSYMPKDSGGRADFFFVMPGEVLDEYWSQIIDLYIKGGNEMLPDYTIFSDKTALKLRLASNTNLFQTDFPAVIVRSSDKVECWRIVNKMDDRVTCENMTKAGEFFNFDHRGRGIKTQGLPKGNTSAQSASQSVSQRVSH